MGCNYSSILQIQRRFIWTVVDITAWINDYIPPFYEDVITNPCPNLNARSVNLSRLQKDAHDRTEHEPNHYNRVVSVFHDQ